MSCLGVFVCCGVRGWETFFSGVENTQARPTLTGLGIVARSRLLHTVVIIYTRHNNDVSPDTDTNTTTPILPTTMKFTFTTITALIAPILGQSITPAPTSTDPWYGSGPPWASSDPGKWSSIYESLLSAGKIPSTLTAAPWPTGSYGPGQGPWGPGGPHGPGGPGRHWGGKIASIPIPTPPYTPSPSQTTRTSTNPSP